MTSNAQIQKLMASVTSVFWQHSNVEFKQTKLELTEIPECLKTKSSPIDKARDVFSLWPPIISASTVRYRKTSWYATGEKKKEKKKSRHATGKISRYVRKHHRTPQEKVTIRNWKNIISLLQQFSNIHIFYMNGEISSPDANT